MKVTFNIQTLNLNDKASNPILDTLTAVAPSILSMLTGKKPCDCQENNHESKDEKIFEWYPISNKSMQKIVDVAVKHNTTDLNEIFAIIDCEDLETTPKPETDSVA